MPNKRPLIVYQGNPVTLAVVITQDDSEAVLDLSTVSDIKFYIKDSAASADASATVLTKLTGEITVVSAVAGTCTIAVPASATVAAGVLWYRLDCLPGPKTAAFGSFRILDT